MDFEKKILSLHPFVIPVKGLAPGKNHFEWAAGREFFELFENSDIIDADLKISVDADSGDFSLAVECRIEGHVTVICDRCLENLELPVSTSFEEEDVYDLTQDIYDFVCLSLPMQRVHPEGACNEETLKYLSK